MAYCLRLENGAFKWERYSRNRLNQLFALSIRRGEGKNKMSEETKTFNKPCRICGHPSTFQLDYNDGNTEYYCNGHGKPETQKQFQKAWRGLSNRVARRQKLQQLKEEIDKLINTNTSLNFKERVALREKFEELLK